MMGKLSCPSLLLEVALFGKIMTEPLVHFLMLGLLLFVLYQMVSSDTNSERTITVTDDTIAQLTQRYTSIWQRPPNHTELNALVENYIKEEILYRQGLSMGLDQNDPVIKRLVLQKLEVLSEESTVMNPPTETELDLYLEQNAEQYTEPARFSLQQVKFDFSADDGEAVDIKLSLAALNRGADPFTVGDSSMLPVSFDDIPLNRLALDFGEDFANAVNTLPLGSWQGPIRSGFGIHLVRINKKTPAKKANLADVRALVERDWENARRKKNSDEYYMKLRKSYDVQMETRLPDATVKAVTQ